MALTSARLEQAMQRLADRFPAEVLEQYDQLLSTANADDAVKAMNLLLPNYVFSKKNIPAIEFAAYNTEIEQRVNESVGEFDLRQVGSFLPRKTLIIYGEGDFEKPDNTKELQGQPTKVVVLPEVGHFPFAEKPQQFIDTVTQFLRG
jgi:pimeloyl-ACP methyl ester carboxylesterase